MAPLQCSMAMASILGDSYHLIDESDKDDVDEDEEDDVFRPSYTDDCDQLENPEGVSCNQGDPYRKIDGRSPHINGVIDVNDVIDVIDVIDAPHINDVFDVNDVIHVDQV